MKKKGFVLLMSSFLLTSTHLSAWWPIWKNAETQKTEIVEKKEEEKVEKPSFLKSVQAKVSETIQNTEEVPGFTKEEFAALRPMITEMWNSVTKMGWIQKYGIDEETRPSFIALQAIVQHVLTQEKDLKIMAYLFDTHPTLSLCTIPEPQSELDALMRSPSAIYSEAEALRSILEKEGGRLNVFYLKDHLADLTEEQQSAYAQTLMIHPNNLRDVPLEVQNMPPNVFGISYALIAPDGIYFFSSQIPPEHDKRDVVDFGIWFGSVFNTSIWHRPKGILQFVEKFAKLDKAKEMAQEEKNEKLL